MFVVPTVGRAEAVSEDICCYCGSDVDGALIYLETFAPDEQKARFEARIQSLFESRWMMEMVEGAMSRVYEFPDGGNLFYDILNKAYLWKNKCTESEMLEMLNLERSRYYDKKKEAIMVFGLALILSILVYTFFSRMFDLMLPPVAKHSIVVA